jgi:hypothetical protein
LFAFVVVIFVFFISLYSRCIPNRYAFLAFIGFTIRYGVEFERMWTIYGRNRGKRLCDLIWDIVPAFAWKNTQRKTGGCYASSTKHNSTETKYSLYRKLNKNVWIYFLQMLPSMEHKPAGITYKSTVIQLNHIFLCIFPL